MLTPSAQGYKIIGTVPTSDYRSGRDFGSVRTGNIMRMKPEWATDAPINAGRVGVSAIASSAPGLGLRNTLAGTMCVREPRYHFFINSEKLRLSTKRPSASLR